MIRLISCSSILTWRLDRKSKALVGHHCPTKFEEQLELTNVVFVSSQNDPLTYKRYISMSKNSNKYKPAKNKNYSAIPKPVGSNFLKSIDDCPNVKRVIVQPRVSSWQQERRGCLDRQQQWLNMKAIEKGHKVVGTVRRVESGWHYGNLNDLGDEARRLNAAVFVVCQNRLARSRADRDTRTTHALTEAEWGRVLMELGEGVIVICCCRSDANGQEQEGMLKQVGQWGKNNKGGRPWSWERCKARVFQLRKKGLSYKSISEQVTKESKRKIKIYQVKAWCYRAYIGVNSEALVSPPEP